MARDKNWYIQKAFAMSVREAEGGCITGPPAAWEVLKPYAVADQENFLAIYLDGAQRVLKVEVITKGLVNRTLIHSRELFRPAILVNATSLIVAHNHPSGSLEPSREDKEATKRMREAGKILGIEVLDHLIISRNGFFSLKENGDW